LLSWSVVTPETLGGPDWEFFSATCFFYGLHLTRHPRLAQTPIGLIQAAYGSTELKAWSPPEALDSCRLLPSSPSGRAPPPKLREGGTGRTGSGHSGVPRDARGNATGDAASTSAVASPASPMTTATLPPEAPVPVPVEPPHPNAETNSSHNGTGQANDGEWTRTASLPVSPSTPSLPPARPPSRPPSAPDGHRHALRGLPDATHATALHGFVPSWRVGEHYSSSTARLANATRGNAAKGGEGRGGGGGGGEEGAWRQDWRPEPSTCYNAMIYPLRHMSLRGVVWDQVGLRGGREGGREGGGEGGREGGKGGGRESVCD
jgi:hypothetical protein